MAITLDIDRFETIRDAVEFAVGKAGREGDAVEFEFNTIPMRIRPDSSVRDQLILYDVRFDVLHLKSELEDALKERRKGGTPDMDRRIELAALETERDYWHIRAENTDIYGEQHVEAMQAMWQIAERMRALKET